jgi:deoxyribonuclease V
MKIEPLHPWNVSPSDARHIQCSLKTSVSVKDDFSEIEKVAGVEVGYKNDRAAAAVVVFSFPELEVLEQQVTESPICFPYIPGLLSFREIPPLVKTLERLVTPPDLIIADGQGTAHPLRMGFASHLGILTGIPTIGCARSRLTGTFRAPGLKKGAYSYLYDKDKIIGAVVRTRDGVKPVFVSPGHKISLETAVEYILKCSCKYRLPEPIRSAHILTREPVP